jgi:hypothetical protein
MSLGTAASTKETRWTGIAMVLILVLVALVMFFDVLFLDKTLLTSSQRMMFPWSYGQAPESVLSERSFRWDPTLNYYPRRYLAHENLMSGNLPLWNPHSAGGMPLLADFQSAVYYPPNLVLNLGDPLRAMGWAVFLHVVLAGLGTFAFLRYRGMSAAASVFGALAFMFNGFIVTRVGHPTMIQAAAWLPWLLLAVDGIVLSGRRWWFVGLAAAVALSVLSGFPQITVHCFAAALLYLLYRFIVVRPPVRTLIWALVFAAAGVGLTALQIVPTVEFARQSGRLSEAMSSGLWHTPGVSFLKVLIPQVTGSAVDGTNWIALFKGPEAHPNDIGLVAYVGVLPLILGLLMLPRIRSDSDVRFFYGVAGLVVLGSMVRPVFSILYLFLPGAGAAQADRLAFLLSFCIAFLGARGFATVSEGSLRSERGRFAGSVGLVLACLAALSILAVSAPRVLSRVAAGLNPDLSTGVWVRAFSPRVRSFLSEDLAGWVAYERSQMLSPAILLVITAVLLVLWRWGRWNRPVRWIAVAITIVDLFLFGRAYYTPQPMEDAHAGMPGIQFLQENRSEPSRVVRAFSENVLSSNFNAVLGIDDAQGYNALMIDRYGKLFDLVERGTYAQNKKIDAPRHASSFASPVLDLLNVEYVLAEGSLGMSQELAGLAPFSGPELNRVYARDLLVYRNEDVLPRATWLARARLHPSEADVTAAMVQPGYDPARAVRVEGDLGDVPWWVVSGGTEGQARQVTREPQRVVLDTSSERPGWLRWAEAYYPGWRVEVDGAEVRSWRADLALRAVPVPAGKHRVELRMDPASTRAGFGLSLLSLVLLMIFVLEYGEPRRIETSSVDSQS